MEPSSWKYCFVAFIWVFTTRKISWSQLVRHLQLYLMDNYARANRISSRYCNSLRVSPHHLLTGMKVALGNASQQEVCNVSISARPPANLSPTRLKSSREQRNVHLSALVMRLCSKANSIKVESPLNWIITIIGLYHCVNDYNHFTSVKRRPFRILIKTLSMILIGKSRRPVRRHFTAHFDRDNVATRQISLQNLYSRLVEMAEVLCAFHRVLFDWVSQKTKAITTANQKKGKYV